MNLGRSLIIGGLVLLGAGLLLQYGGRLPFRLGRLPGDIVLRGKNSVFFLPLTTMILLSLALNAVLWLIRRR